MKFLNLKVEIKPKTLPDGILLQILSLNCHRVPISIVSTARKISGNAHVQQGCVTNNLIIFHHICSFCSVTHSSFLPVIIISKN